MDCQSADGSLWCLSCHGEHAWCRPCAVKAHASLAFHRLQEWNGQFYDGVSLHDIGYTLNLGHNGDSCPLNASGSLDWTVDKFTVVASAGIFVHTLK